MSFLDSLIYSFSNIFSIGPDLYDDGDECCGGVGPGGTCCKNFSPKIETTLTTPSILSCQQKQELQGCHCSSDDTHGPDASWRTIKLVVCGQQLQRQKATLSTSPTMDTLALLEKHLEDPSDNINTCTVALDRQCQDILLSHSSCVFILSDTKRDNTALNRLLGWMNEQITSNHHRPLQHLFYGIVYLDSEQKSLASLFQQKLDQLGATAVIDIGQQYGLEQWATNFMNGLRQIKSSTSSSSKSTTTSVTPTTQQETTSAGCTHGMVDVEELGQVARKIKQTKEQRVARTNLRGRSKRMIELDISYTPSQSSSFIKKAAPTTGPATLAPTYGSMSSILDF
ncbi:hypothetical protein BC941DRAFT_421263 [Chlamydoabsidia padenii]|nr:hypothetical protein BC941DRAFT_421263 [Chlamydoabsidia padenii]